MLSALKKTVEAFTLHMRKWNLLGYVVREGEGESYLARLKGEIDGVGRERTQEWFNWRGRERERPSRVRNSSSVREREEVRKSN